jgi:hypothetical protein
MGDFYEFLVWSVWNEGVVRNIVRLHLQNKWTFITFDIKIVGRI